MVVVWGVWKAPAGKNSAINTRIEPFAYSLRSKGRGVTIKRSRTFRRVLDAANGIVALCHRETWFFVFLEIPMSHPPATTIQLVLANERTGGRLIVGLEPFLAFDIDMTHRLQNLVERWADKAVPNRQNQPPPPPRKRFRRWR